jgi:hypothetical protein
MTTTEHPTEADYFRLDSQAHRAMRLLRRTGDAGRRSGALVDLAEVEWHHSTLHTAVFGVDPYPSDGCPQAEWLADSARMLWIVAEAEFSRHQRGRWPCEGWVEVQDTRSQELIRQVEGWLGYWVEHGGSRRRLLGTLVGLWTSATRGQAVEVIACIPVPRWSR